MNSIELKIQDVKNFQNDVIRIGQKISTLQTGLKSSLSRVGSYWRDDSMTKVIMEINKTDTRLKWALNELVETLRRAVRKELEWADRYNQA